MSVSFPNPSRSFDEHTQRVCFWGYDGAMEISFFIGVDALKCLNQDMENAESGYLRTFDAAISRIHEVANKAHKRGGKGAYNYELGADSFSQV